MSDKDGGPAFPSLEVYEGYNRDREQYEVQSDTATGMSLRDYFAGQALMGIMANAKTKQTFDLGEFASDCYEIADAMLKERAK